MLFMNWSEIEEAVERFDMSDTPNLRDAAHTLNRLMEWADRNSDGWAYWRKPAQSAQRLMLMLIDASNAQRSGNVYDVTRADLTRAYSPIKAMMTRAGFAGHKSQVFP